MVKAWVLGCAVVLLLAGVGCAGETEPSGRLRGDFTHPRDGELRLNHLQSEATHNSYHLRPNDNPLPNWDYSHAPLDVQLDEQGVRGVELDVHFSTDAPIRVLHVATFDPLTTCGELTECLEVMRGWSDAHPGHHTIFVQIEPKSPMPLELRDERLAQLEATIREVLPPALLVTPDDVRGSHATLAEALAQDGWPTLGETRGRFLFYFDCSRELCLHYAGDGQLAGRVMFPDSEMGDPFAGVMVINGPGAAARAAVEAGYLVRVFSDGIAPLLAGDPDRLEEALATGAHIISTDVPAPRDDLDYFVEMPGGTPSRCNPVTAPDGCAATDIEDPARLTGAPGG